LKFRNAPKTNIIMQLHFHTPFTPKPFIVFVWNNTSGEIGRAMYVFFVTPINVYRISVHIELVSIPIDRNSIPSGKISGNDAGIPVSHQNFVPLKTLNRNRVEISSRIWFESFSGAFNFLRSIKSCLVRR